MTATISSRIRDAEAAAKQAANAAYWRAVDAVVDAENEAETSDAVVAAVVVARDAIGVNPDDFEKDVALIREHRALAENVRVAREGRAAYPETDAQARATTFESDAAIMEAWRRAMAQKRAAIQRYQLVRRASQAVTNAENVLSPIATRLRLRRSETLENAPTTRSIIPNPFAGPGNALADVISTSVVGVSM